MTQNKRTPAARQGSAGREAFDSHREIARQLKVELLRGIMRDIAALDRAGRWPEARERCLAALKEQRDRARKRSIGTSLTIDLLANEVVQLTGINRDLARAVARETLLDTPLAAIARELRACRAEWLRHSKRRTRP